MDEEKLSEQELLKLIAQAAKEGATTLDLSGEGLTSLPVEIGRLTNLTALYLHNNQLTSLPAQMANLTNLTLLSLNNNQLTELPAQIGKLRNLTTLKLTENQLTELPVQIGRLKNLTELWLQDNQLTGLPAEIGQLTNLTNLYLFMNQLTEVPTEIGRLEKLEILYLEQNELTSLPGEIWKLKNLKKLDLRKNKLTSLPKEVLGTGLEIRWEWDSKLNGVFCEGNPFESPPVEVVKRGTKAVRKYFEGLEEPAARALNEVKVLLVGDGGAGKTSLVKRLLQEAFDKNEEETHGINIRSWQVTTNRKKIKVNMWDFGGQHIMHATHQFFLSKRSLYVLVLDGRKEEDAEYWLKHIESFGGDSPILIVLNKIDQTPSFDVNRPFLQEKYKGIKGFYRVSCRKRTGIAEFVKKLKSELGRVELIKGTWPGAWFKVKTQLEKMSEDFISYKRYRTICKEAGIDEEEEQDTLLDYFHDLGVAVHFEGMDTEETSVLEPRWLTGGVYKVINSEVVADRGILELDALGKILRKKKKDDYTYPRHKHRYIVDMMMKFQLCYRIVGKDAVLLPALLPKPEPVLRFDYERSLKFYFEYDFLPASILPRFFVQRHRDIDGQLRWRTGVVLRDQRLGVRAVVKADVREKRIYIWVSGDLKRDYFAVVRKTFNDIHDDFEKLAVVEWVPLPDVKDFAVEYEELIGYDLEGREEIFFGKLRSSYSVSKLLNGIEKPEDRIKRYEEELIGKSEKGKRVYWVDGDYIEKGSGMEIRDINISGGNVNFADKIDKIIYNENLGISKEDFDELKGAVGKLSKERLADLGEMGQDLVKAKTEDEKTTMVERIKTFLIENGVPVAQGLTAAGIFEIVKALM